MVDGIRSGVELRPATETFLSSGPMQLLIGNEWVPAADGGTFETLNPSTGATLAQVASAGAQDVDRAVQSARKGFESDEWAHLSGEDRGQLLWNLAELVDQHADELAEIETLDNGKPLWVARRGDVPFAAKHLRYYAGLAGKLEGATIPVSIPKKFVYTLREPIGVVGLIIPWNFPLLMATWKISPALAAGNCVILKPAEQTPLTALRLGQLVIEAGFPPGAINILTGPGIPTGSAMTSHHGIDKISFTGSTSVGREVMRAASESNLKRVTLELGGKSPHVIFADADLPAAISGAHWGCFSTAGQECTAGTRLLVEKPVYDQVIEGLLEQVQRIRIGDGFTPKIHLGPIISASQLERVMGYIQAGRESSAELLVGGERLGDELESGYFLSPTVFAHTDDQLDLVQQEIFGPVLAVSAFEDWSDLIDRSNATQFGLAAGAWTTDLSKAHRYAAAIQAGSVWVNGYGLYDAAAPYGGMKHSGFGREMGQEALELYSQTKTVWIGL